MDAEQKLQQLLESFEFKEFEKQGKYHLAKWFMQQFSEYSDDNKDACSLKDFAEYFIRTLRKTTASCQQAGGQYMAQNLSAVNHCGVKDTLSRLVTIYTILVDYNLETNLLHEILFLLRLLNDAEQKPTYSIDDVFKVKENGGFALMDPSEGDKHEEKKKKDENSDKVDAMEMEYYIEKDILNDEEEQETEVTNLNSSNSYWQDSVMNVISDSKTAIFFAVHAFMEQRDALSLMDLPNLESLIDCGCLQVMAAPLVAFLQDVSRRLAALDPQILNMPTEQRPANYKFTEFYDDRMLQIKIPNQIDIRLFKQVRNRFYALLAIWERTEGLPDWMDWNVTVRKIFDKTEDVKIMWQLAQLFVTQLLDDNTVKPVLSSYHHPLAPLLDNCFRIEFDAPGYRCFYKHFIASVDSAVFLKELQTALFKKLVELYENEMRNVNENQTPHQLPEGIFLVKAMPDLLVLAKFLGYVQTRWLPENLDDQISRRFSCYVMKVAENNTLILTMPWVVQYLITLRDSPLDRYYSRPIVLALCDLFKALSSTGLAEPAEPAEPGEPHSYNQAPNNVLLLRYYMGFLFSHNKRIAYAYYDYCQSKFFNAAQRVDDWEYGAPNEAEQGIQLDSHQHSPVGIDIFVSENKTYEQFVCSLDEQVQSQLANTTLQLYRNLQEWGLNHVVAPLQQQFSDAVHSIRHTRFRSIITLVTDYYVFIRQLLYERWQREISTTCDEFIDRNYRRYLLADIDDNQRTEIEQVLKREVKNMLKDWSNAVLFRRDFFRDGLRNMTMQLYMRNNNLG